MAAYLNEYASHQFILQLFGLELYMDWYKGLIFVLWYGINSTLVSETLGWKATSGLFYYENLIFNRCLVRCLGKI